MASSLPQPWRIPEDQNDSRKLLLPSWHDTSEGLPCTSDSYIRRTTQYRIFQMLACAGFIACFLYVIQLWAFIPWTRRNLQSFEGKVPNAPSFLMHLGGFCFGCQKIGALRPIGAVTIRFFRDKPGPLWRNGSLFLLSYDDQVQHWKSALQNWNTSTWQEKVAHASSCMEVMANGSVDMFGHDVFEVVTDVEIIERYVRRWNFVLFGFGLEAASTDAIQYRFDSRGALLKWGPGPHPKDAKCPGQPIESLKETVWNLASRTGSIPEGIQAKDDHTVEGDFEGGFSTAATLSENDETCLKMALR